MLDSNYHQNNYILYNYLFLVIFIIVVYNIDGDFMILEYLSKLPIIKNLTDKDKIRIKGSNDNFNINLIAIDFLKNEKSIFVVAPNLYIAQKYYDELINLVDDEDVLFFPADELITSSMIMESGDFKFERINTILSLVGDDKKKIIVTNFSGAIRYELSHNVWNSISIKLSKGMEIDIYKLIDKLLTLGYKMDYTVRKTGEFAHRGSIVDIFPLNSTNPIRLDFFGDEIDDIRYFDLESQKSIDKANDVIINPVTELIYNLDDKNNALRNIDKFIKDNNISDESKIYKTRLDIENRNNLDMLMTFISFFDIPCESILDYVPDKKVYFIDDYKINNELERMHKDIDEYILNTNEKYLSKIKYYLDDNIFNSYKDVVVEGVVEVSSKALNVRSLDVPDLKANAKEIIKEFRSIYKLKTVICTISNDLRRKNLKEVLREEGIPLIELKDIDNVKKGVINIINDYSISMNLIDENIIIYSEKTLFDIKYEQRKIKFKSIYKNTYKISRYDELEIGDYVVHYDFGIGKYLGLSTQEVDGFKRDYINISYAKGDNLYLPIEQINMIQKYANPDDRPVKLNDLSSGAWKRAKLKVRNKIRDISDELIKLYSSRSEAEGFVYSADSTEQLEFESDFEFDTTPDQEKAIRDVKKDMMSNHPMDRLVCGDVGYGKTEVALRAAFKAVLDGKQVCVLAPTTILSRQHYYTFKERMEKYGARVALLNRFISTKEQNSIIKKVATGEVDVLIGTHRILSSEIKYHDLGLLIVDEEQRFGVTHKEKIKQLKVNVDTITLSATPIPRTLQMSIVGIRDLSMIETPPKNRYPIQTYVLERNDSIIKDAILKEISRGGQVYYMYNRVEDIEIIAAHIKELVPDARICIGHGKMKKEELEDTLVKFIDHEYDVLVCTTIIETGLDIPDTNTIIIHNADRLGLSQAYQIRGRVGRSDRIAYAYLMFDPNKELTPEAEKRLQALKEFSDLGSGFKIAMRDLAIRGAGDILGAEQSGFIESVGLEMYMKILEEELQSRKGEVKEEEPERDASLSKIYAPRHIDKSYIDNEDVRIEIHKKIDKIETLDELEDLDLELKDRFGEYDKDLSNYMYEKLFKKLIKKLDIERIEENFKEITLVMSKKMSEGVDGAKIFVMAHEVSDKLRLRFLRGYVQIIFEKLGYKDQSYFEILDRYLDKIINYGLK